MCMKNELRSGHSNLLASQAPVTTCVFNYKLSTYLGHHRKVDVPQLGVSRALSRAGQSISRGPQEVAPTDALEGPPPGEVVTDGDLKLGRVILDLVVTRHIAKLVHGEELVQMGPQAEAVSVPIGLQDPPLLFCHTIPIGIDFEAKFLCCEVLVPLL